MNINEYRIKQMKEEFIRNYRREKLKGEVLIFASMILAAALVFWVLL